MLIRESDVGLRIACTRQWAGMFATGAPLRAGACPAGVAAAPAAPRAPPPRAPAPAPPPRAGGGPSGTTTALVIVVLGSCRLLRLSQGAADTAAPRSTKAIAVMVASSSKNAREHAPKRQTVSQQPGAFTQLAI